MAEAVEAEPCRPMRGGVKAEEEEEAVPRSLSEAAAEEEAAPRTPSEAMVEEERRQPAHGSIPDPR